MQQPDRVRQTVILAAGSGTRLAHSRGDLPKPLMVVAGLPLIGHALEHARASGCDEAVVVIGFDGSRVQSAVEAMQPGLRIRFVQTPDHRAPNGVSLLAAEPVAAPAFYLQMVDHLFAAPALSQLTEVPLGGDEVGRVLIDSAPAAWIDLSDATKVQLADGRVSAIGKGLDTWHAVDAGCFVLTPGVFDALRQVAADAARTVSSGMRQLAAQRRLGAVDVRGAGWIDVDTPGDHQLAEQLLGQKPQLAARS